MRKNYWFALAFILIVPAMLFTVSCAKEAVQVQPEVTEAPPQPEPQPEEDLAAKQQAEEQARLEAERLEAERAAAAALAGFENEHIYFEFDSSALQPSAQETLAQKADYMRQNPGINATIEGNCDERGTDAYNLALGERRANSAKDFLINLGIDGGRLSTISYGEERPLDYGHNEEAWAKNRRDQFVVD
jgi:peptidoglycan-associated lipoprotein